MFVMNHMCAIFKIIIGLFVFVHLCNGTVKAGTFDEPLMKLWYTTPATDWMTSALPIGNGELGAMFFGGTDVERIQFNEKTLWSGSSTIRGAYQNFGDIYIHFADDGKKISQYKRELILNKALGIVHYKRGETVYRHEYFASYPDKAIVVRIATIGNKGNLNLAVSLKGAHGEVSSVDEDILSFSGKFELLSYEAQVKVLTEGGSLRPEDDRLIVSDANAVTLVLVAGTNFDITSSSYVKGTQEQLHNSLCGVLKQTSSQRYRSLKGKHFADYCPLFHRVSFDLGQPLPDVPTDELIRLHKDNLYIDMLYFQYGRYLMLASSRGIALPNNLQGIWNHSNTPPWESDIHSNINIQMNYWPAESCNLSECHVPFLDYVVKEAMRPGGSWTDLARSEGLRGWTIRTQNNIFGYTDWNINRPANAWYCMHLWQHYLYTQDDVYLKEKAFPVMQKACEYWFDRLKRENGLFIAPDEWSPEQGGWEDGVSYAQQLIWQLFYETAEAIVVLDTRKEKIDPDFVEELYEKFSMLDNGLSIGKWGQICEWKEDIQKLDTLGNQHRHLSQLIALYPGYQILTHGDHALIDAARRTLVSRGDGGTGWSRAWKIACWARLQDGNHAYALLKAALMLSINSEGGVYANLFDAHPPFQIDGNFGATAGVAEMLLQSYSGEICMLPALPDVWKQGRVKGLKAVGNFEIGMHWDEGKIVKASIISHSGKPCTIRTLYPIRIEGVKAIQRREGEYYLYSFNTKMGKEYVLDGI